MKFSFDPSKLIRLDYWLDPNPGSGQLLFLIVALKISFLLLISGLVIGYLNKKYFSKVVPKRNFYSQLMWTLYSFSVVSFLLTFIRVEGLGGVSIRIIWPLFGLVFLATAVYFLISYKRKIPEQLIKIETDGLKKKYFRTKKRKK